MSSRKRVRDSVYLAQSAQHCVLRRENGEIIFRAADKLRALLAGDDCIQLPGCHDAMGAKLIQEAGFKCAYLSGFAVSASRLAEPDIGIATYTDMVETARACCEAVSIPVIGDGDTGYGGLLNVRRTVHGFARAGLAAISIEDQTFPKRCAYSSGVQFVSREEAVGRVRAALKARDELRATDGLDLVIIARTDSARAKPPAGSGRREVVDEALARCVAFQEAGADVVYAEGLETIEEMRRLNELLHVPTMIAQVERPNAMLISTVQAKELGFKLSLRGVTMLNAQITATKRALATMRADGALVAAPVAAPDSAQGSGPLAGVVDSKRDLMPFDELCATVNPKP